MEYKRRKQRVDLSKINKIDGLQELFQKDLLIKFCFVPFFHTNEKIFIAMDTYNQNDISMIEFLAGKEVEIYKSNIENINNFITLIYKEKEKNKELFEIVNQSIKTRNKIEFDKNSLKDKPIVWFVDRLIQMGIDSRASDVHIEPFKNEIKVRFRIDGVLNKGESINKDLFSHIINRIKLSADMDITEKRTPQDGKIIYKHNNIDYDIRVSTIPVIYGEKIVLRILSRQNFNITLDKIGIDDEGVEKIRRLINENKGIILVTGPTGSGKSTTLFSMMSEINTNEINITTVENPVEYQLEGVNQINVNEKANLTFHSGLRSILRQDPDVIMIGEIRDEITAQIACRSAITGHLVLSTLHTKDSLSAVPRLLDMDIPKYMLDETILAVISQRLIRKICEGCKKSYKSSSEEKKILGEDVSTLYKGSGCQKCNGTGFRGRVAISEIVFNEKNKESYSDEKFKLYKNRKIAQIGKSKVIEGITTLEEYLRGCS